MFVLANSVDPDEMPHYAAFDPAVVITNNKTVQDIVHSQDFVVVVDFLDKLYNKKLLTIEA